MANRQPDLHEIFNDARERETDEERSRYLDEACRDAPETRARIEALLRADSDPQSLLAAISPSIAATLDQPPLELPGTQIGPYKLLEQIGEGGMGVVYHASQRQPIRRTVALKIIKPGMDTREVVARFEAERQALALMDHPNIAKVFDAGATESGRPYFVMELVPGVPMTDFCDRNDLTTRERLELFVQVCQAAQHAHQKGIIHRDLKPSNVLVTSRDGVPIPKIIDFGVAKATNQQLSDHTVFTGFGQMVGTPLYMSPEQAELNCLDVDTRSDIYSLGVLLYELLTGTTPFDKDRLREAGMDEVRRVIREADPPRPSTRISTLGEAATTVSIHRKTDPVKLSHSLRGELDWIVMKAMEKDRTRRYETAIAFAKDIQRYLDDEPVEACPPSATYRLGKLARRYKVQLVTVAAIAAVLVVASVVSTWLATWALHAEGIADSQRADALDSKTLAEEAARLAKRQKELAIQQRDVAERNLYLANMRLALQDWKAGQTERMNERLERHLPQPGEPDLRGWEWYYLLSLCHKDLLTLRGHTGSVRTVAWNPDGKRLASGSDDGVRIWDAATGSEIVLPLGGYKSGVWSVAWSPDGGRLASGDRSGTIKIWNGATAQEILSLQVSSDLADVATLAWSPDGKYLAWATRTVEIWDTATGEKVWTKNTWANAVAWSPDGKRLAYGSSNHVLNICDVFTEENPLQWTPHRHCLWAIAWSPDGKQLVTGSYDQTAKVWEADTGRELLAIRHAGGIRSVAWSPNGKQIASASERVRIWDAITGEEFLTLQGHIGSVSSVVWSPDGKRLASGGSDGTVKIWDADCQQRVFTEGPVNPSTITWSLDARKTRPLAKTGPANPFPITWSLDGGRLMALQEGDPPLKAWDIATGKEVSVPHAGPDVFDASSLSPNGRHRVVFAGTTITVRDQSTGEDVLSLIGHIGEVWMVRWSPDGHRLASAAWDGTVRIWDATNGQNLLTLRGHTPGTWVGSVTWSPGGERLASSGADQTVRVWDASTGQELLELRGHTGSVWSVHWSPDGRRLASSGFDGTAKIWDVSTGEEIVSLDAPGENPWVAWSPDGKCLAAATMEGTLRVWDTSIGHRFVASPEYRRERAHTYYQRGIRLARSGRFRESDDSFHQARRLAPPNPAVYIERADAYYYRQEIERAIADCTEATRIDPDYAKAHRYLAEFFTSQGKLDEAVTEYREALRLKSDDHTLGIVHLNLGNVLSRQGKLEEVIAEYREAIPLTPDFPHAHSNLGMVFCRQGKLEEAIAQCREAVRIKPDDANAHTSLGIALNERGKLEEGIAEYQEAIRLKPDDEPPHHNLAEVFYSQGKLEEAVTEYRESIRLRPSCAGAHADLAVALRTQGKLEEAVAQHREAVAQYRETIRLTPSDAEAHRDLAWLLATAPDPKWWEPAEALELAMKAVQQAPENASYLVTLGTAQYRAGHWEAAIEALEKATKLDVGEWFNHNGFFLSMAHWQLGHQEEARRQFQQSVEWMEKYKPADEELQRFRAEAAQLLGEVETEESKKPVQESKPESDAEVKPPTNTDDTS